MRELLEKSFLGAAIVFGINHVLGHLFLFIPFLSQGEMYMEGTFFGMLYNLQLYFYFIFTNGVLFFTIKHYYPKWHMSWNVILVFIAFNFFLQRNPLGNEGEIVYYVRYLFALSGLFMVNTISDRFSWVWKSMIIASPLLFSVFILVILSFSG
ncbi:hypothetical protein [Bacillus mesophilum]|uniref:Uncharacterized protein n=1 Tax=Bacillus mesophilum TaxID=1071718 RepID=A0A7V7RN91_9BACI|nr:hypothetical protein [Bacillus mesophilum]KAB2333953.1 hypothetical protein F7732_07670 [Bacillus mesophilum]